MIPTHVQHLAIGVVDLHEIHMGPPLKPIKVPLDDIPALQCGSYSTQLDIICILAAGAVDPTTCVH